MNINQVNQFFGNLDIYLLDQILKDRFSPQMKVLDAGCGEGRNLQYFLNSGYEVWGIDQDPQAIEVLRFLAASRRPDLEKNHFQVGLLEKLPFTDEHFQLIIASAVLHFAKSHQHFQEMWNELIRCLQHGGILFVRMTSDIGLPQWLQSLGQGRYLLPDGSERYLLTRELVKQLVDYHQLHFLEPLKTVNVQDQRCMTTLVLGK